MPDARPDSHPDVTFDRGRQARIGLEEAVLAEPKTPEQIAAIIGDAMREERRLLLTRLTLAQYEALPPQQRSALDYCALSRSAILGALPPQKTTPRVALVSAGTSDAAAAAETRRVLAYSGLAATQVPDVGVAGLWRLLDREPLLREMQVVIVFAGMDAALPSVVAGLVPGLVIAVPTSVGYGVATGGRVALDAALASCAPGVLVTNIDNGYGAACAALRFAHAAAHPEDIHAKKKESR
ncbi:nickel pincer cofactor biosynthesis protein LarB [Paracoccus alkanivorans]|uniref:Nickel pincer cofactor biosynthesis protein LarB n=1 Tax=Paracoccus alkanivorans TaxID=2116655 RepID=A0A3M0MJ32_9RHOB|nr:nickel pincer cofactor biosynthesis protein LarB [Paracoccus alkanivorans]RMC35660.1 nickel pincer cofactor biosynthesis protein LarB [Paracoccus alkanivorans]